MQESGRRPRRFRIRISDILSWSRACNPSPAITGALLFDAGSFARVLEGPADTVMATLGHIVGDRCNGDLKLLESGTVETREFRTGRWPNPDATGHGGVVLASLITPLMTQTGRELLTMLRYFISDNAEIASGRR